MRRFVPTPVRVESAREGQLAIRLVDANGVEFLRIPTPNAPGGHPTYDTVALACAYDLERQFNELGALVERALARYGPIDGAQVGLEVTTTSSFLADWALALSVRDSDGSERLRVTQNIDPTSYARDAIDASDLVRRAQRALKAPGPVR